jgi:cold shock CspA family protein
MSHGIIKRILPERGCGFIASAGGLDVYFKSPDIKSHTLRQGQHVCFKVELARKGFVAHDVRPDRDR